MSFVGITLFADDLFAFADSKSSVNTIFGYAEEPGRGNVQKIFRARGCLFAMTGYNTLTDRNGDPIRLDAWLKDNMEPDDDALAVLGRLYRLLLSNEDNRNKGISLLEGGFDQRGSYARSLTAKYDGISIGSTKRLCSAYCAGAGYYISDGICGRLAALMRRRGNGDFETRLTAEVQRIVEEADEIGGYNPAGPPIYAMRLRKYDALKELKGASSRSETAKLL